MKHTIVATSSAVVLAAVLIATGQRASAAEKPAANGTVTVTGCLRADGNQYKLTSLQGENLPKSRSWKSGYLKKSSKEYQVVSTASNVKLKDHVNHQVTVTGSADGSSQLKARSLKHVAPSCS